MIKEIVTDIDSLSVRSDEIDVRKDNGIAREIIINLKDTIKHNNLTSLAAIQIGYNKRIFCINFKGDIRTFVNPIITNVKGFELSREVCPSLPEKTFIRPRYNQIEVTYQTPLSKIESTQLIGLSAKVFQECVDHLDGLLLSDVGLEIDADFDSATETEREEVIRMYLDSLDIKQKEIEKEIQEDPELKQVDDAIKFIEGVQKGEVTLKEVELTEEQLERKNKLIEGNE